MGIENSQYFCNVFLGCCKLLSIAHALASSGDWSDGSCFTKLPFEVTNLLVLLLDSRAKNALLRICKMRW